MGSKWGQLMVLSSLIDGRLLLRDNDAHGAQTANSVSRSHLSRDESGRPACGKAKWQVHAYCLMPNHFHLVVETPQPTLVAGMKWLLGTYTGRFNRRHREFGHLFSGRYKALLVGRQSEWLS